MKKIICLGLGFLFLGLGTLGAFVPILPTVPFYLGTAFFFGMGSETLHQRFIHSALYKRHLESYVERCGMTLQSKGLLLGSLTVVMGLGFFMMKRVLWARWILLFVWLGHVLYFGFHVPTIKKERDENNKR